MNKGDIDLKIHVNETGQLVFGDIFTAIVMSTDQGDYAICQRDGGIEVVHKGKVVYSSTRDLEADALLP